MAALYASEMRINCPHCHQSEQLARLRQPYHLTFGQFPFGLLGGAIGGVFWALSQDSKFQCGQCNCIFFSHTTTSRVFFVLCILVYSVVAAFICYGLWTATTSSP